MNAVKLMLSLLIVIFLISCATSPVGSDRLKGYNMAGEFAKKDAMNSTCFRHPRYVEQKARKYTQLLQDQGRSETFIKGFYDGYEDSFHEFFNLYCGR